MRRGFAVFDGDPAFIVAVDPGGAFDRVGEFAGDGVGHLEVGFSLADADRTHLIAGDVPAPA